jgi:hypothetical protein
MMARLLSPLIRHAIALTPRFSPAIRCQPAELSPIFTLKPPPEASIFFGFR